MKKIFPIITITLLSIALASCVGGKKTPSIESYSFTPKAIQQASTSSQNNAVIRMMPANITPQFANASFVYRTSAMQYRIDPYRQFLTAPNTEVTTYLESDLAPLLSATLISGDNLTPANFILQENITELYADYQNKSAPEAVISIQFILYRCDNGVMKQVGMTTLSEKTSIKPNDPVSLLEGYQEDLDKMAKKLSKWINLPH